MCCRHVFIACDYRATNFHHLTYNTPHGIVFFLQALCLGAKNIPLLLDFHVECFETLWFRFHHIADSENFDREYYRARLLTSIVSHNMLSPLSAVLHKVGAREREREGGREETPVERGAGELASTLPGFFGLFCYILLHHQPVGLLLLFGSPSPAAAPFCARPRHTSFAARWGLQ